jgi:hypothetical protein
MYWVDFSAIFASSSMGELSGSALRKAWLD